MTLQAFPIRRLPTEIRQELPLGKDGHRQTGGHWLSTTCHRALTGPGAVRIATLSFECRGSCEKAVASGTQLHLDAAADAGVDDFLTKPLNLSELWTRVRVAERILRYTTQVRQLEELLPICSYCKKIRDDHNYWQQIEGYINERTGSEFSHSICPDCYTRVVVPELNKLRRDSATPGSSQPVT